MSRLLTSDKKPINEASGGLHDGEDELCHVNMTCYSHQECRGDLEIKPEKIEYRITPTGAFRIIRNCAGCGEKRAYESTGCFRINANGNKLDIWLIYQCSKCKHSYNLTIYERLPKNALNEIEYRHFMENDAEKALQCGLDKSIFNRNKAEIADEEAKYEIQSISREASENMSFIFYNPYRLRIRTEKVLAEVLQISRHRAQKILKSGEYSKYVGQKIFIELQK
jgi:hypothetical protein